MQRTFTTSPAVRARVPLLLALAGASGSGKTYSALRLAVGMQKVFGGAINVIDTESNRALHYADTFKFEHTPFPPPFSPDDYADVLAHVSKLKPGIVIVDQLSYEHDGIGGLLEWHETELDRMAGQDWAKRDKCNMAAWIRPKAARRRLINEIVQVGEAFALIMLFRAKETAKPVKGSDGKLAIEDQGYLPIAGPEFLYEATASCVLLPRSNGVPTWKSAFRGEDFFNKRPKQFETILAADRQLSETMGEEMARWASGNTAAEPAKTTKPAAPAAEPRDLQTLCDLAEAKVREGLFAFNLWADGLTPEEKRLVGRDRYDSWKARAA
jgi:hypothetical protein